MTDIWRSTIKQLVLSRKFEPRKSSADEKLATSKPTESMNPLRASRTDSSSSTIVTRLVVETASFTALYPGQLTKLQSATFFLTFLLPSLYRTTRRECPPRLPVQSPSSLVVTCPTMLVF